MEPLSPNIAEHIPLHGSCRLHGQENLQKTTWRSYERFECEFGNLVNVNTILRASDHLGKDNDMTLRFVQELSLEDNGTAFQRNRKADQLSDENHWH